MRAFVFLSLTALGMLSLSSASLRAAEAKLEETVVGPANAGGVYTISQRGANVAFASTKGSRLNVTANGVEGPLLDELFNPLGASFFSPPTVSISTATAGGMQANSVHAVIYSDNGEHYAYAGRQGNEYVVIHDGKEIGRGPRQSLALNYGKLTISPKGKYVYWGEMKMEQSRGTWRLVINGQPGPWCGHHNWEPVFSPDDSRFAYNAVSPEARDKTMLIIDGKVASYVGHTPMFTADSKVLLTIAPGNVVLVDGKPAGLSGIQIENVTPAPVGSRFAVIMRKKLVNFQGVGTLYLDGKEVPGTEGAQTISFSPDGKHYALSCINAEARSAFMIIDGKKGNEYQSVADSKGVYWTPDSSKIIYTAGSGGRNFVVVDGQEIAVQNITSLMRAPFVVAGQGNRYAFSSADGMNRNFLVIVDGQQVLPSGLYPYGDSLTFSGNGSRYAYVAGPIGRNEISGLVVDGTLATNLVVQQFNTMDLTKKRNPYFVFSPDGKHLAQMARQANNANPGLYVNNQLVYSNATPVAWLTFTPDSQHLYWIGSERFPDRPQPYHVVYADGQAMVKLSGDSFQATPGAWETGADGVLTFIAVAGNDAKRFRVTPSPEMNVATMMTNAEARMAKALVEAEAAKKKAADDAAMAAAKAKSDADAAAAKKKADYDAAVAAKAKARQDAINAKKLQQLNAQRARQKLPPLTELPPGP